MKGTIMTDAVLLVDDDSRVLHSLARMLQAQPYQLYTARSGEDAMDMLKARKVDVIVVDERMPGMSGTDLIVWAARHYPEVARILLTGYAVTETLVRAVNEGAIFHFFPKPCNEASLAIAIRKALERKERLANEKQLLELNRQQASDRDRFGRDLEALERLISRDVKGPLRSVARDCQSLMERHSDLFDPTAESLIESSLEAISDMQCLINQALRRIRGRPSGGLRTDLHATTPRPAVQECPG